jgi:membrane-associated protein
MLGGYWLGQIPLVHENLEITVLIIIIVTSLLVPFEIVRERLIRKRKESGQ